MKANRNQDSTLLRFAHTTIFKVPNHKFTSIPLSLMYVISIKLEGTYPTILTNQPLGATFHQEPGSPELLSTIFLFIDKSPSFPHTKSSEDFLQIIQPSFTWASSVSTSSRLTFQ